MNEREDTNEHVERLVEEMGNRVRTTVEERTAQLVAAVHASATRATKLRDALESIAAEATGVGVTMAESAIAEDDMLAGVPASAWREPVDFMRARIFDLEVENAKLREAAAEAEKKRQVDNERNDREGGKRYEAHTAERESWQRTCDKLRADLGTLEAEAEFVAKHLRHIDDKSGEEGFLDGSSEAVCYVFEALPQYADRLVAALALVRKAGG